MSTGWPSRLSFFNGCAALRGPLVDGTLSSGAGCLMPLHVDAIIPEVPGRFDLAQISDREPSTGRQSEPSPAPNQTRAARLTSYYAISILKYNSVGYSN